jgi:hypothetical protein
VGGGEVHRNLHLRNVFLEADVLFADPRNLRQPFPDLQRLVAELMEVLAEDPDGDRFG